MYCEHYDDFGSQRFHIYVRGWATDDDGDGLHHEESGCGAIARWHWDPSTETVTDPVMGDSQAEYMANFHCHIYPHMVVSRELSRALEA